MADPVSWFMIRPGWKVYASDGAEVGSVDEVAGDESQDIFDGLAVATSALGKPVYVPSESVGPITDDKRIELTMSAEQFAALGEYLEPATSEVIEADNKSGFGSGIAAEARKVEGAAIHPAVQQQSVGLIRRISLWFKRERG
ncbi:MAG TPA: hypothetical protein VGH79_02820 [Gaiellaceae bacterium]|jgi:hypothetical protein